ncbi:carboxypeptidase-like regulatory domain-containing protein [Flavobacterium sp. 3HN19-14]|uniref:carboxypeptidase-like regulatory domain-containing protein n=1 Tax=Flavobacterium sp. 3HN19-14 TaxID=3448133 RepID=UPI003EE10333
MKSNYLLIYILLLSSAFGFAQNYDIGGTVKESATGFPLPGVSIQVKNATQGTISDLDGNFTLKGVPSGTTVVFTYVGFQNYEYKVTNANSNMAVSLREESKSLDEVVVIGYGTQKKKDLTGSVGLLDSKTIDKIRPAKVDQALQGTVTGVIVSGNNGSPGAGFDVKIRGVSSNQVNRPVAIIDGYQGEMSDLNPADIETITVLKMLRLPYMVYWAQTESSL